jgi:hypothetical protein
MAPDKQRPADFDKRVAIPAQGVQHPANMSLKDLLVRIVPQLIISQCARYFGVQVGPMAHLDPWGPRIVRYEDVVRSIGRLGLGIAQFHRPEIIQIAASYVANTACRTETFTCRAGPFSF